MSLSMPFRTEPPLPGIEPARLQFIQREFQDVLGDRPEAKLIHEIHEALFTEGKSVAVVRNQLTRQRRALRVIAVTSGKGGVGKTTVSVNLAVALAAQGQRVLLFDADLGMANVHIFAGVTPRGTLLDVVEGRLRLAQILTSGPAGVQVVCGASGVAGLADLDPRVIDRLGIELARLAEDFDVLLIDTGAGISAQVMQFLALAHEMIVVATPNLAATLDAYGVIKVAREANLAAQISIIVNQTDDESEAGAIFARLSGCAYRFLQFLPASLGSLRRDRAVETANQSRQPLVLSQPGSENARRFAVMASRLAGTPAAPPHSAAHAAAA
jgi:flagellar biosynthesis protein FlhG